MPEIGLTKIEQNIRSSAASTVGSTETGKFNHMQYASIARTYASNVTGRQYSARFNGTRHPEQMF